MTFDASTLRSMNYSSPWNGTINTPKAHDTTSSRIDTRSFVLVPTGECSLNGRTYEAIEKKSYQSMSYAEKREMT